MTFSVLGLVLLGALTHALWNTWLKISGDRLVALAMLAAGWAIVGMSSLPFVGLPSQVALPHLLTSTVVHTIYALLLIRAYRHADLSTVYPIARGTAPLIVTVVSVLYFGDSLGLPGFVSVILIVTGVVWLGAPGRDHTRAGLLLSLLTGGLIGTYTLLDGLGGRAGQSPHGYAASLFVLTAIPLLVLAAAVHRRDFLTLAAPIVLRGIVAGALSAASYWVVVWAMTVAPMGLVAAVRESSVVFVAVLGYFLHERVRWIPVALVVLGIMLTRLT